MLCGCLAVADDIVARLVPFFHDEQRMPAGLIRDVMDEIERLRRLGDTLAYHVRADEAKEMYSAVHAWQEARRG